MAYPGSTPLTTLASLPKAGAQARHRHVATSGGWERGGLLKHFRHRARKYGSGRSISRPSPRVSSVNRCHQRVVTAAPERACAARLRADRYNHWDWGDSAGSARQFRSVARPRGACSPGVISTGLPSGLASLRGRLLPGLLKAINPSLRLAPRCRGRGVAGYPQSRQAP